MKHPHANRLRHLTGIPGPILTPGSDEWTRRMSASKVAAVLGLSPFTSRFTLWHEMAGTISRGNQTVDMRRGHYLEPAVAQWFADMHPDWKVIPTGTWTHPEFSWATATPDRLALIPRRPARVVEVKTTGTGDGWGPAGSSEIPPGYRAQVVWSMFVTGAHMAHVVVLLPFLDLREYVIEYDEAEAFYIHDECKKFMLTLFSGDQPPLDGTDSTYATVRELHPDIDDEIVELDAVHVEGLLHCKAEAESYAESLQWQKTRIFEAMGSARKGVCNGYTIATRTAKSGGVPYLSLARSLPTPEQVLTPREEPLT